MTWASCPTHGPIQDASEVIYGGVLDRVVCKCGLTCEPYEPVSFVEHSEIIEEGPEEVKAPKRSGAKKKKASEDAEA